MHRDTTVIDEFFRCFKGDSALIPEIVSCIIDQIYSFDSSGVSIGDGMICGSRAINDAVPRSLSSWFSPSFIWAVAECKFYVAVLLSGHGRHPREQVCSGFS